MIWYPFHTIHLLHILSLSYILWIFCAYSVQRTHILTDWGWVTHISVVNLTNIGSDNGLSPGRRQAIIWTNARILLIGPLGTNFSEILIGIQTFSFKKIHFNMSSVKWHPSCLGLNVLKILTAFCKVSRDNLLSFSDVIWHHGTWSTLVQVMAWRQTGAKPLPEPMLTLSLPLWVKATTIFYYLCICMTERMWA